MKRDPEKIERVLEFFDKYPHLYGLINNFVDLVENEVLILDNKTEINFDLYFAKVNIVNEKAFIDSTSTVLPFLYFYKFKFKSIFNYFEQLLSFYKTLYSYWLESLQNSISLFVKHLDEFITIITTNSFSVAENKIKNKILKATRFFDYTIYDNILDLDLSGPEFVEHIRQTYFSFSSAKILTNELILQLSTQWAEQQVLQLNNIAEIQRFVIPNEGLVKRIFKNLRNLLFSSPIFEPFIEYGQYMNIKITNEVLRRTFINEQQQFVKKVLSSFIIQLFLSDLTSPHYLLKNQYKSYTHSCLNIAFQKTFLMPLQQNVIDMVPDIHNIYFTIFLLLKVLIMHAFTPNPSMVVKNIFENFLSDLAG